MTAPTTANLRRLVGAGAAITDATLQEYLDEAAGELGPYVEDKIVEAIPDGTFGRAQLIVAVEMYNQDKAPNGILNQQYDAGDGLVSTPIRIGSDPLRPAYPILARYMPGAIVG